MKTLWAFLGNRNWMLWALLLGVATGLIFGERVAFLQPIGTGFVKLMQITIFPYIVVSLIVGLGKFNPILRPLDLGPRPISPYVNF